MKAIDVDVRRYAWCRSNALWFVGMPALTFLQDVHGARKAEQDGLQRYAARMIGDACAVALNMSLNYTRPIPSPALRSSWALEGLQGHELYQPCWELIRGVDDASADEIVERCEDLISRVRGVVGDMPNILTPEGHYPAIALARDWLKLMNAVGEDGPLPTNWVVPT
ncbi:MAG: hypothetical protein ACTHO8_14145 [Solirubrobacterales bacterium]